MSREQRYIDFFSQLSLEKLNHFSEIFDPSARFKDPFNNVTGINAIQTVFSHMYANTEKPEFTINHSAKNDDKLFLQWDFNFTKNNKTWKISGSSMITFNHNDLAIEHIDYWDPAEQIYSKIALLKPFMQLLNNRLKAD